VRYLGGLAADRISPQKSRGFRPSLLTVLWFVGAALAYIAATRPNR
jgi:hypothetical protein